MRTTLGAIAVVTLGLVVGCAGDGPEHVGGATGVKECNEFLTRFQACIPNLPADARPTLEAIAEKQQESLSQGAQTAAGRVALVASCTKLIDRLLRNPACTQ